MALWQLSYTFAFILILNENNALIITFTSLKYGLNNEIKPLYFHRLTIRRTGVTFNLLILSANVFMTSQDYYACHKTGKIQT